MFQIHLGLPSGRSDCFSISQSSQIGDLKRLAQKSFGLDFFRLVTAEGRVLGESGESLQAAGIQDGDHLVAIAQAPTKVAATKQDKEDDWDVRGVFAWRCGHGGKICTWGKNRANAAAHASAVPDQVNDVKDIQATRDAFAAILEDGSVITWGSESHGGDSSVVQDRLRGVQHIQAAESAFAAILADGSVITWGSPGHGGDSSSVQDRLRNVQHIQSTRAAFAAILEDGSVITWGSERYGGDSSLVQDRLRGVQHIQATDSAFAAILADGSVITWGRLAHGGHPFSAQHQLRNVQHIQATHSAFAAILEDGAVVTWNDYSDDWPA